jgi:hypothetical protein
MAATPCGNDKKSGPCPLFRIRPCRIAGLQCCQFIRGQRRFRYRRRVSFPSVLAAAGEPPMPIWLTLLIIIENDRHMTSPRHFCGDKSGRDGISSSHAAKIR